MVRRRNELEEVNSSSMADIAFLLLIFFLITTTITTFKGVGQVLPEKKTDLVEDDPIADRNMFKVILNSNNALLVEDEVTKPDEIREKAIIFLDNRGRDKSSSDSPSDAIISFRTDRGTDFESYITVLDELKGAYNELRARHLGFTVDEYLELDMNDEEDLDLIKDAKKEYPYTLSEAEPTNVMN